MSTEIVKRSSLDGASLPDMVRYAEHLANANLLPGQYRKQPANVLYAMEYGRTLGITPLAAITGIHVIEGKPSASAALISGLVRQAGHKLRVRMENGRAVATIVRFDDPGFEFRAEWDMDRAKTAGLTKKDVWLKYPQAMLKARAISEVARDACEEVLFGLHYTPEELDANVDAEGEPVDAQVQQLRRVPAGEADPWAAPTPQPNGTIVVDPDCVREHPEGQTIVEAAAKATHRGQVKERWAEAQTAELLNAIIKAPDSGEFEMVREYLGRIGKSLPETASEDDGGEVVDGEIVPDKLQDEHAAAEAELRAFAAQVGIDDIDRDAEGALGLPLTEAPADAIRGLLNQLRGTAA